MVAAQAFILPGLENSSPSLNRLPVSNLALLLQTNLCFRVRESFRIRILLCNDMTQSPSACRGHRLTSIAEVIGSFLNSPGPPLHFSHSPCPTFLPPSPHSRWLLFTGTSLTPSYLCGFAHSIIFPAVCFHSSQERIQSILDPNLAFHLPHRGIEICSCLDLPP